MKPLYISSLVFLSFAAFSQEALTPRPSPLAIVATRYKDTYLKITYSQPQKKRREIFGGLVPFEQVWRTGANEATTFVTDTNLSVGGKDVPAGSYTIFTVPNSDAWALVISKKTGEWGTDYPGENEDLARVPMSVSKTSAPVENFTIVFDQKGGSCALNLDWENTRASVDITEKK